MNAAILCTGESIKEARFHGRRYDLIVAINHTGLWISRGCLPRLRFDHWASLDVDLARKGNGRKDRADWAVDWDRRILQLDNRIPGECRYTFPLALQKVLRDYEADSIDIYGVDHEGGGIQGKDPMGDTHNGRWNKEGSILAQIYQKYEGSREKIQWLGKWKPNTLAENSTQPI